MTSFFLLLNFGNQKKSLWPPIEQIAPTISNVLGLISVLLETSTYLALYGDGNVITIVLLNNVHRAHLTLFLCLF